MSNINPYNFGVIGNQYYQTETNENSTKNATAEEKATEKSDRQISSDEVLGFLAAQNTDLVPTRTQETLDVDKYVTAEQKERIAGFVKGLEADYDEKFTATKTEFPELSDNAASEIALATINASYK